MTSAINPNHPEAINASTAAVRANFAAAKAEIEQLQAQNVALAINVKNYLTAAQLVDVRAGNLTFNSTPYIQAAIDDADALSSYVNGLNQVPVILPAGLWRLDTAVNIKTGILFVGEGVLHNNLVSSFDPCVVTEAGASISRIVVDGNSKGGIRIGVPAGGGVKYVGDVNVYNVGLSGGQRAVYVTGSGNFINSIVTFGGVVGVSFGDGVDVANGASTSFVRNIYCATAVSGIAIHGGGGIDIGRAISHSHTYASVVIDRTKGVKGDFKVYWDDAIGGTKFSSGGAVALGTFSAGDPVKGLDIRVWGDNTAGPILRTKDVEESIVHIVKSNGTLASGNANPATTPLVYVAGYGLTVSGLFRVQTYAVNPVAEVSGTVYGSLTIEGTDSTLYSPGFWTLNGLTLRGDATANLANNNMDRCRGWLHGRKSILFQITSSTAENDVTNFGTPTGEFVVPNSMKYAVRYKFHLTNDLLTTGFKLRVANADLCAVSWIPDAPTAGQITTKYHPTGGQISFSAAECVGANSAHVTVEAIVTGPVTSKLTIAQSTSSASPLTVEPGGTFEAFEVQ